MSARVSLAPGSRRGPGVLSSSLASSQAAASSSQSAFSFRPHILLSQGDHDGPLLDYSDLTERIEVFKQLFEAQSSQAIKEIEISSDEHASRLREEQRNIELTKKAIEQSKEEQKSLYQTIASERQADSSALTQLSLLQTSRASLTQRLTEAEEERDRLKAKLDLKMHDRENRKARLLTEVKRNRPELLRFNEKLGCRISAGNDKAGKAKSTMIKFTFNLINPDDWKYEAKFVIDASKSNYQIVSHSPAIPQDKLDAMLLELNTSRALFTFIKKMRAAFKDQVEQQRLANRRIA